MTPTYACRSVALAAGVFALVCRSASSQTLDGLTAGARVRASGEGATNDGIRRFAVRGTVVSADSAHVVVRRDGTPAAVDTIVLFGVRRFELFQGHRSRASMVATGVTTGAVVGVGAWLFARATIRPTGEVNVDNSGRAVTTSSPVPTIVHSLRNAIPGFMVLGGLVALGIGDEQWARIPVPQSVYPQAR
jgi:hypothetical protein